MQKQQRMSSCFILLFCLLSSQSVLALRESSEVDQMMVDGQMEGSIMHETAADAVETEWCNPLSSQSLKRYFFDIAFEDDSDKAQTMAIELRRDPVHPHLKVYPSKTWEVDLGSCAKPELEYSIEGPVDAEVDIDILNDVSYVKLSHDDQENPILEIEYTGGKLSFAGGIWYAPEIMLPTLKLHVCTMKNKTMSKSAADLRDAPILKNGEYVKEINGVPAAAYGTSPLDGGKVLAVGSMATALGFGAAVAIFPAAAIPLIIGANIVLPFGTVGSLISTSTYNKKKLSKAANYAASKKIFDKLSCHPKMIECKGLQGQYLVPEGKMCPQ